ncbi:MAG: CBS domain-containing protein, partial [gamma proteobacterium symbiont of Phacoides pectinatus]
EAQYNHPGHCTGPGRDPHLSRCFADLHPGARGQAEVRDCPGGRQERVTPGEFLGLANYLDNNDYSTLAEVIRRSRVLLIPAQRLKHLEVERPDLFNMLNRIIASRLRERSPDRTISSGVLAQPVTRVMKSPVSACAPHTSLGEALLLMQERKIGTLAATDRHGRLRGVVSFSGLARAAILEGAAPDAGVLETARETPRVIDPDTPLWEAEELLKRHNVKYLLVTEAHRPIGILSQSDILRVLISRPGTMTGRLRDAGSLKELAALSANLLPVATEARDSNHRPSDALRLLSEVHLIIQRRAIELTLRWMQRKGHGPPPLDYAFLIMGSGGRKEMLLNPDQDNGIILADDPGVDPEQADAWFELFCERVNRNLARVGYPLCPGQIMASNPAYRKRLSSWKTQVSRICARPSDRAARWSNVVFDFDTLYGQVCRYLVKDFGTSQSPKSTRQRDSRYCPD